MLMRTIVALAAVLVFGTGNGWASGHKAPRHHRHPHIVGYEVPIVRYEVPDVLAVSPSGGRLVSHPANNIACMTQFRSTRALPCDQPVWVYGSPCEVDLGLGRYRSCD
jgi:hypothetical protein